MENKTVMELCMSDQYESANRAAEKAVNNCRVINPDLYTQALKLQRMIDLGGLWRGMYISLNEIINALSRANQDGYMQALDQAAKNKKA